MIVDREHSVLEHLCALRATQADPGERLIQIELQMHFIDQRLSALTKAVYGDKTPSPTPASLFRTFASDSKTVRGEALSNPVFLPMNALRQSFRANGWSESPAIMKITLQMGVALLLTLIGFVAMAAVYNERS